MDDAVEDALAHLLGQHRDRGRQVPEGVHPDAEVAVRRPDRLAVHRREGVERNDVGVQPGGRAGAAEPVEVGPAADQALHLGVVEGVVGVEHLKVLVSLRGVARANSVDVAITPCAGWITVVACVWWWRVCGGRRG